MQVGLVKAVELDLGTTLLFTGAYNIITGMLFGIPMPVQVGTTFCSAAQLQLRHLPAAPSTWLVAGLIYCATGCKTSLD